MSLRSRRWIAALLLAAIGAAVLAAAAREPYLPIIHGSEAAELARLAEWLQVGPGMRVADIGAGEGKLALALARRVGPSGQVFATEIGERLLATIREAAKRDGLGNITVIEAGISRTNLPEGCCDAVLSRIVYHHLSDHAAINADVFRVLRPGGRLLMIDFEPGGIMEWLAPSAAYDRGHGTRKATLLQEVTAAGFRLARGPDHWRGRMYAVLFTRP
jgi:ubiquinone/menaquinone biosynthesis C-methylase UbiE